MLDAIVFDYNGTLVDDLDLSVDSYHLAGTGRGHRLSRETVLRHISQPPSLKRSLYFGEIPDAEWQALVARRKAIYRELAQTRFRLFPETEAVLARLSGRFRLGVLSNTFRDLFEALFPARLRGLFQATLFFDEVDDPRGRPRPLRVRRRRGRRRADGARRRGALVRAADRRLRRGRVAGRRRRLGRPGSGRAARLPPGRDGSRKCLTRTAVIL